MCRCRFPRHGQRVWRSCIARYVVAVLLLWLCVTHVMSACHANSAVDDMADEITYNTTPVASPGTFRCMRSFATLSSMSKLATSRRADNCNFHYFGVHKAWASLHCTRPDRIAIRGANAGAEEDEHVPVSPPLLSHNDGQSSVEDDEHTHCYVTVHVVLAVPDNIADRVALGEGSTSDWYFRDTAAASARPATATSNTTNIPSPYPLDTASTRTSRAEFHRPRRLGSAAADTQRTDCTTHPHTHAPSCDGRVRESEDMWRYSVELRAPRNLNRKDNSSNNNNVRVQYNGYDGQGYSVCCDLLTPPGAQCMWDANRCLDGRLAEEPKEARRDAPQMTRLGGDKPHDPRNELGRHSHMPQERVIAHCVLHNPTFTAAYTATLRDAATNSSHDTFSNDKNDHHDHDSATEQDVVGQRLVYATARKPLHRNLDGMWSVNVAFFRARRDGTRVGMPPPMYEDASLSIGRALQASASGGAEACTSSRRRGAMRDDAPDDTEVLGRVHIPFAVNMQTMLRQGKSHESMRTRDASHTGAELGEVQENM